MNADAACTDADRVLKLYIPMLGVLLTCDVDLLSDAVYVWKLPVFYELVAVSSGALQKLHLLLKCAVAVTSWCCECRCCACYIGVCCC